jgi:hypothetical protein
MACDKGKTFLDLANIHLLLSILPYVDITPPPQAKKCQAHFFPSSASIFVLSFRLFGFLVPSFHLTFPVSCFLVPDFEGSFSRLLHASVSRIVSRDRSQHSSPSCGRRVSGYSIDGMLRLQAGNWHVGGPLNSNGHFWRNALTNRHAAYRSAT